MTVLTTELSTLLSEILAQDASNNHGALQKVYDLSVALEQENTGLKQDVLDLKNIIQEVRRRDANKKCLCRGRP